MLRRERAERDGPTITPTRMKPMTGVIRIRANAGMTIPAAPRIDQRIAEAGGAEFGVHVSACCSFPLANSSARDRAK